MGRLKTNKIKINKNQIEKKRKANIYSILSLKLWYQMICGNQPKGSKIRIFLLIEYLKTRTLLEIRITPQARSIMSSLNDSCWSNISTQEHLIEIRITPQAWLIMSSLNDTAWEVTTYTNSSTRLEQISDGDELNRRMWSEKVVRGINQYGKDAVTRNLKNEERKKVGSRS